MGFDYNCLRKVQFYGKFDIVKIGPSDVLKLQYLNISGKLECKIVYFRAVERLIF